MMNQKDAEKGKIISKYLADKGMHRTHVEDSDLDHFQEILSLSSTKKSYLKKVLLKGSDRDFEDLCSGKRGIHKIMKDINKRKKPTLLQRVSKKLCTKRKTVVVDNETKLDQPKYHKVTGSNNVLLNMFRNNCENSTTQVSIYSEIFNQLLINRSITKSEYDEFISILDEKINSIKGIFPIDRKNFHDSFEKFKLVIRYEEAEEKYSIYHMLKLQ